MTRTTTPKIGLSKPTPGTNELVDISLDVGDNWDAVDEAVGAFECTEATKPATPWDGQFIRCSDSRRLHLWNTTQNEWDYIGGGIGQEKTIYKTADQSRTSNTALIDVDEMQFDGLASTKYGFKFVIFVTGSTTGDLKISTSFPSGAGGATVTWFANGADRSDTPGVVGATVPDTNTFVFNTITTGTMVIVEGYAEFGTTAGTLKLRFAQSVSDGTATTILKGSKTKYTKLT